MNGEIRPGEAEPAETRSGFTPNLVVGVGVTLLGVLLTLDKLEVTDALVWLRYWPVLLTLFGLSIAYQALRGSRGDKAPPILSAPLIILLIFFGVLASRLSERTGQAAAPDSDRPVSVHALMSGNRRVVTLNPFRHGEVTTVMGETRLDLRQATIPPGEEAVVDIVTVMGSTIVYVPDGWDVNFDAVPVMGGVKDERRRPGSAVSDEDDNNDKNEDRRDRRRSQESAETPPAPAVTPPPVLTTSGPAPRLVLRGFVMMGGLVIRS
jgi:hypothetical protein